MDKAYWDHATWGHFRWDVFRTDYDDMLDRVKSLAGKHAGGVSPGVVGHARVGQTRVGVIIPLYDELKERLKNLE
jgi:hypothetical protein